MRNSTKIKNSLKISQKLMPLAEALPSFSVDNLRINGISKNYLRTLVARKTKSGELIRLKKGFYTSKAYLTKAKINNELSEFLEYLSSQLYQPSYLSLEYILYEHGLLTEMPVNFTLMTTKKTVTFKNQFGVFIYHSVKRELFNGFIAKRRGKYLIYKASIAKALFDFLYLRKSLLKTSEAVAALRLNTDELKTSDIRELKRYVKQAGTKRLSEICQTLLS